MQLVLRRDKWTEVSTTGNLLIDGQDFCFTLEPKDRRFREPYGGVKVMGQTAIPRGTYKVKMLDSKRWGKQVPHVLDVPEFEGVEIHPGNYPQNTDGCILLGSSRAVDFVGNSRATVATFTERLVAAEAAMEETTLEVI